MLSRNGGVCCRSSRLLTCVGSSLGMLKCMGCCSRVLQCWCNT